MNSKAQNFIRIRNACEHNLKNISLDIPHNQLIVVTGVSGSGKSSLAFDVITKEGQGRFFETYSSFSRQFIGKLSRPAVDSIDGLFPVISLVQKTLIINPRSTVGTISDLYDFLRLLYARLGVSSEGLKLSRSLFSFNTSIGACPVCNGLGLEEKISEEKLITDQGKTLREGVLAPSLPNGYIMYSQVTLDVLNQVCDAHGFSVDIPWKDLTEIQRQVVLYGSTLIKVPFGKHPLENRLKWTGITAKPREEGFYRGLMPVMSEILKRDRNDNILKYVESVSCSACSGKRLNSLALSVTLHSKTIDQLSEMEVRNLKTWLLNQEWSSFEFPIATPVIEKMIRQISLMENLGMGHLTLERSTRSLSAGESQRLKLVNQVASVLCNILYVFDEPSIGLHPSDKQNMLEILRILVKNGNTVIVVEHDETFIRNADWIIDIGPGAGEHGGKLLFNGSIKHFLTDTSLEEVSPTYRSLTAENKSEFNAGSSHPDKRFISIKNCCLNNLKNIDVRFQLSALNVVTGVSGSGKNSLVHGILESAILSKPHENGTIIHGVNEVSGTEAIDKLITIDQQPIGRTPRSNPATYTGLADKLRDLFAKTDEAKLAGFGKSRFSFNTTGGRCENCLGAGSLQIGMHFLGNVDVICPVCSGKRFNEETLKIKYQGKSILEVLEFTVEQAITFFSDQAAILKKLRTLEDVGLGYIHLGQASTTLSGGEAQRIKLATELQQTDTGNTLYILDEPTIGLHISDIETLLKALQKLIKNGNTVICIEHDSDVIRQADWVIDLGPGNGELGGNLMFQGFPNEFIHSQDSLTARSIMREDVHVKKFEDSDIDLNSIVLNGVQTHQLKNINVSIPRNKLTVITGVSGSGKSSLAFDTLFAEAQSRFSESLSTYARSLLKLANPAKVNFCSGLGPAVAINRKYHSNSSRSTMGTLTGLYDHYRLMFSRLSQQQGFDYSAQHFSFNHQLGACPVCDGLGVNLNCDPEQLITHPERSILDGAMIGHKTGKFYGDPFGQYVAALKEIAAKMGVNFSGPWYLLDQAAKEIALYGTGSAIWDVTWTFKNKTRSGDHRMTTTWIGFCNLINDEYKRKYLNKNTRDIEVLFSEQTCSACGGSRLNPKLLEVRYLGKNIAEITSLTVNESLKFFEQFALENSNIAEVAVVREISFGVTDLLKIIEELGLGYLTANRSSGSLSGGEGQRLRIAGAFSARLFGVTYILDEPTIGLHSKDTISLVSIIRRLISSGNTVVVVEHDEQFIRQADTIIEMGPGAGAKGGMVTAYGSPDEILKQKHSLTSKILLDNWLIQPSHRLLKINSFGIINASRNNLKNIDIRFSSGGIIAVTGVSGSGKSTLIRDVLWKSAQVKHPVGCDAVYGLEQFSRIQYVDQLPISDNSLSTPATFTGLMDVLRDIFAETEAAQKLKLSKSAFSYMNKEGKCADCNGYGQKRSSMDFMSDIWTICETCNGSRYKEVVLSCLVQGYSIGDVLEKTVDQVLIIFEYHNRAYPLLKILHNVGIGHIKLGQAGNTLSGGEVQRLKLASELIHQHKGTNLYMFDEPATGLHYLDVEKLISVFNDLADRGNTLIFIEHNPMMTGIANQVIVLGPGSGPEGGQKIN